MKIKTVVLRYLAILVILNAIVSCQAVRNKDIAHSPTISIIPNSNFKTALDDTDKFIDKVHSEFLDKIEKESTFAPALGDKFKLGEEVKKKIGTVNSKAPEIRYVGYDKGIAYEYGQHNKDLYTGSVSNDPSFTMLDYKINSGRPSRQWVVRCNRDKITDAENCSFSLHTFNFETIISFNDLATSICIGSDNYPGSYIQLRVDKNSAHRAPEDSCLYIDAEKILTEIKSGEKVITRFVKWPEKYPVEREFSTYGFSVAIELMHWLYARL